MLYHVFDCYLTLGASFQPKVKIVIIVQKECKHSKFSTFLLFTFQVVSVRQEWINRPKRVRCCPNIHLWPSRQWRSVNGWRLMSLPMGHEDLLQCCLTFTAPFIWFSRGTWAIEVLNFCSFDWVSQVCDLNLKYREWWIFYTNIGWSENSHIHWCDCHICPNSIPSAFCC